MVSCTCLMGAVIDIWAHVFNTLETCSDIKGFSFPSSSSFFFFKKFKIQNLQLLFLEKNILLIK